MSQCYALRQWVQNKSQLLHDWINLNSSDGISIQFIVICKTTKKILNIISHKDFFFSATNTRARSLWQNKTYRVHTFPACVWIFVHNFGIVEQVRIHEIGTQTRMTAGGSICHSSAIGVGTDKDVRVSCPVNPDWSITTAPEACLNTTAFGICQQPTVPTGFVTGVPR